MLEPPFIHSINAEALFHAALSVLNNWESGDLAAAVRELNAAVTTIQNQNATHTLRFEMFEVASISTSHFSKSDIRLLKNPDTPGFHSETAAGSGVYFHISSAVAALSVLRSLGASDQLLRVFQELDRQEFSYAQFDDFGGTVAGLAHSDSLEHAPK